MVSVRIWELHEVARPRTKNQRQDHKGMDLGYIYAQSGASSTQWEQSCPVKKVEVNPPRLSSLGYVCLLSRY